MNIPVVERARSLFEFLLAAQQLKARALRMADVDGYQRDGTVCWLAEVPQHSAVTLTRGTDDPAPGDPLLVVDRVERVDPPEPGPELERWLTGPGDDPRRAPELRTTITAVEEASAEDDDPPAEGPAVPIRELGPRELRQVPPAELAAVIAMAAEEYGWENTERTLKGAARLLGYKNLSKLTRELLDPALHLALIEHHTGE